MNGSIFSIWGRFQKFGPHTRTTITPKLPPPRVFVMKKGECTADVFQANKATIIKKGSPTPDRILLKKAILLYMFTFHPAKFASNK